MVSPTSYTSGSYRTVLAIYVIWLRTRSERCARLLFSGEGASNLADEKREEKTYEVKDKRRVNPDGSIKDDVESEQKVAPEQEQAPAEEPEAEPQAETTEAPAEEPQTEAPGEDIPPPNVFDTLQFVTGLLVEQAWQFMGLHLPPGRKEPVTDLVQAKIAIDTLIFVADRLHPHLGEEERKAIRGIVSDLQINFVQRNKA